MNKLTRCFAPDGLNEFAEPFERFGAHFELADFYNHYYFKYEVDEEIKAIFVLVPVRDEVYECHYMVDESIRGKQLKDVCAEVFSKFPDGTFFGFTPVDNKPALIMAALLGFKRVKQCKDHVLFVR